jgi:hypothetical protein
MDVLLSYPATSRGSLAHQTAHPAVLFHPQDEDPGWQTRKDLLGILREKDHFHCASRMSLINPTIPHSTDIYSYRFCMIMIQVIYIDSGKTDTLQVMRQCSG